MLENKQDIKGEKEAEVMDIDGIKFETTKKGIKLLDKLIAGSNELNNIKTEDKTVTTRVMVCIEDITLEDILNLDIEQLLEYLLFISEEFETQDEFMRYIKGMLKFVHNTKMMGVRSFWMSHVQIEIK